MSVDNLPPQQQDQTTPEADLEMAEVGARAMRLLGQGAEEQEAVEIGHDPEAEINPLGHPEGYFDAQVQFAQKWAALTGEDFGKVLLSKTSLFRRIWDKRAPDEATEEWTDLLQGVDASTDHQNVTTLLYDAYKQQPHSAFEQPENPHGFGYDYYPDTHTVKIHFGNPVRGQSPFSKENLPATQQEFKEMLEGIVADHPDAETLTSASWIRSTSSYRNMSPPNIAEQESLMSADMAFGGDSVWGQFLDRNGNTNQRVYDQFVEAVSKAESVDDLLAAFPYKVLRAQDPIEKYYEYYGV